MKLAALRRFRYHALILVGVLIAWVSADLWWHDSGRQELASLFNINFSSHSPATLGLADPPSARLLRFLDSNIFPDWGFWYRRKTSPFRLRTDPEGTPYFPASFSRAHERSDDLFTYSGVLRHLGEPSLFRSLDSKSGTDSFRLTVVHAQGTHFSCRVTHGNAHTIVVTSRCDTNGDALTRFETSLPESAWKRISTVVRQPDFWAEWTEDEVAIFESIRGQLKWILEWRSGSRYEVLMTWSPDILAFGFGEGGSPTNVRDFENYLDLAKTLATHGALPTTSSGERIEFLSPINFQYPNLSDPFSAPAL